MNAWSSCREKQIANFSSALDEGKDDDDTGGLGTFLDRGGAGETTSGGVGDEFEEQTVADLINGFYRVLRIKYKLTLWYSGGVRSYMMRRVYSKAIRVESLVWVCTKFGWKVRFGKPGWGLMSIFLFWWSLFSSLPLILFALVYFIFMKTMLIPAQTQTFANQTFANSLAVFFFSK